MNTTGEAQKKIEAYLGRLRGKLRGMNDGETREIVEELRSHIVDRASAGGEVTAGGVDAALAALGSPEELALFLAQRGHGVYAAGAASRDETGGRCRTPPIPRLSCTTPTTTGRTGDAKWIFTRKGSFCGSTWIRRCAG